MKRADIHHPGYLSSLSGQLPESDHRLLPLYKEYDTALATADSALHLVRKYEFGESDYAKELRYKADILKSMERYSEALPLYERVNQIQDSISTAVSNRQLEEIKDSYHLNQLLLEQGQLRSYIQTIILAVVSVILILCIFTYCISAV